ncbi:MAG: MFS transporter [Proteobacteria bacterium]|nr:MFS transporter [Pseudomonadota bacterium]
MLSPARNSDVLRQPGVLALMIAQALGAFNHNALRGAILSLVAFRGLALPGLGAEEMVGISTIAIVAPYVLLSILAGLFADRWPKAIVVQSVKGAEIAFFALAAIGLWLGDAHLLLLSLVLAGIGAALLGPAKFGMLPELVDDAQLLGANALINASALLAILAGMIFGSACVLAQNGPLIVALGCVVLALVGWLTSLFLPRQDAADPTSPLDPGRVMASHVSAFRLLTAKPGLILAATGASWFWFQAAFSTSLFPVYAAQGRFRGEELTSLLFLVSTLGAVAGALACRRVLIRARSLRVFSIWVSGLIAVPALAFWWGGPPSHLEGMALVLISLAASSLGTGLFIVPLVWQMQAQAEPRHRARIIGATHVLNGLAMIASGLVIILLGKAGISVSTMLLMIMGSTALVASLVLPGSMPPTPSIDGVSTWRSWRFRRR